MSKEKQVQSASLRDVKLTDKYELNEGMAFMSGLQALARIPQRTATRVVSEF